MCGSSIRKAKTIEKPSKVDFTGAAVPLSGTLKFVVGAGPVVPLRAMINKRPGYYVHLIDQQTNQPTDMTCYRHARKHKSSQDHGNPVTGGWAGEVMRKLLGIHKCDRPTNGPIDRHSKV